MIIGFSYLRSNVQLDMLKNILMQKKNGIRKRYIRKKRRQDEDLRLEVDKLLDKINEIGYDGLLEKEKKVLYEASQKLAKGEDRN